MKQNHPLLLLFCFLTLPLLAQKNLSVEGIIADSTGAGLPAATVVLLQQEDSLLTSFGITGNDGKFLLRRIAAGNYLLQVTYVGYETWYQALELAAESGKTEVDKITLSPVVTGLAIVEVKGEHVPMRFMKDTIEYNADAFKTQPGSVVEDLLKRLPGVEVERDGTIKAQGKQVQNVLVDGKEFFGNDPSIATKNLPANAVNKVQVYDKKSEMAEFTGIEDGLDEKTINLMLKDDKKQGYFGNASGGMGLDERYAGRFSINRFSKKSQLSAIGLANNTNEAGFSFQDYMRFMGGLSNLMSGGGGMRISLDGGGLGIPMGAGMVNGINTTWAGGLNFNQDFSKKTRLNASYFYNQIQNDIDRSVERENLLGDESFKSFEDELRQSRNKNHRFNMTLRHEIDSFRNIVVRSRIGLNDARLESDGSSFALGTDGLPRNVGIRQYRSDGESLELSSSLSYRRRFRTIGRAFVADFSFGKNDNTRQGIINSINSFSRGGSPPIEEKVNQRQEYADDAMNYGATISYTEPLGNNRYVELNASRQNYSNETSKDYYDLANGGEGTFNDSLSRHYNRDYVYDKGGLNLKINRKKFNLTAGAALQRSTLEGKLDSDSPLNKSYLRVLPSMFFNYEFGLSRNLKFDYRTNLREPSVEQLQPVVDNSDPLNTYTGNPGLQPEYAHNLGLHLMIFDQFSFTSFFASLNATYTQDRITNSSTIDQFYRRNTTPVNVDHDFSLRSNVNFSTPLRFIQTNIKLSWSGNLNQGILFVNGLENNTSRMRNIFSLSFDNRKKDFIDASIGARLSHNRDTYSESEGLNQTYLDRRFFAEVTLTPTKKWTINSIFEYTMYSAEPFGNTANIPMWQGGITRYILKNNRGQIKLKAFDILDRNLGVTRNSQLNYVQEERIRSLGRYVMLSFAYNISGFGAEKGGLQIKMH